MAATIERIVNATVTKTSATVSRQGFGTILGVHQVAVGVQANRFATYSSQTEMTDAGFLVTDRAYLDAGVKFSQNPRPPTLAIGRRIPGVAQTENISIDTDAIGSWLLDVDDGDEIRQYAYVSAGADEIAVAEGLRLQIEQDTTAAITVPDGPILVDNFDWTAATPGTAITVTITEAGVGASTQTPGVANVPAEDITTALVAIESEVAAVSGQDFYIFTIDTRSDADITAAAAFVGSRQFTKFFVAQTNDPDMLSATSPNLGTVLGDLNYPNVWLGWKAGDAEFFDAGMGAVAAAADLDAENGVITWALKQLVGVAVTALTDTQVGNINSSNGEVYVEIASRGVTLEGKAVSGEFADVQTTIAWSKARLQEAIFAAMVTVPTKLPYDNNGIAVIGSTALGVLKIGVVNQHYSGDDPDFPRVTTPTSLSVPTADKNARILRNVRCEAIISGAIQKTLLQLDIAV